MITPTRHADSHFATAWTAGLGVLMLSVGGLGVAHPLVPDAARLTVAPAVAEEIMLEEFDPPPAPASEPATNEPEAAGPEDEIQPVPEIIAPINPPELPEIVPLDTAPPAPKQITPPRPPEPKPKPRATPARPTPPRPTPAAAPARPSPGAAKPGGTGPPGPAQLFTGGGRGRFPSPGYPAAARASKLTGTVRLLVTVEASGLPSAVSVQGSSGHAVLDLSAADHLRRRWRWPSGAVRRFIVPIRFVLQ